MDLQCITMIKPTILHNYAVMMYYPNHNFHDMAHAIMTMHYKYYRRTSFNFDNLMQLKPILAVGLDITIEGLRTCSGDWEQG